MKIFLSALVAVVIVVGGVLFVSRIESEPDPDAGPLSAFFNMGEETDSDPAPIMLHTQRVPLSDTEHIVLRVPQGFSVALAAEGLGKARFMTMSPDGRLFVPDMVDYNLSHEGRLMILDEWDESTRRFERATTYLSGLRGPNSVAFYTDAADRSWLYLALTEHIIRYPYRAGDTEPSGEPEVVYAFPNEQSPNATGGVWHLTRTMVFHEGVLYVSVGSGCNACEQSEDEMRALVLAMDPEGGNVRVYADGLKNAVGLGVVDGVFYATENGTDHLGAEAPADLMFRLEEGAHYGWPYCYEVNGEKRADTTRIWEREPVDCAGVPMSFAAFPAHSAPLGFAHFDSDAHPALRNSFLVALQGSWDSTLGEGYRVMRISRDGTQDIFLDGFFAGAENDTLGQPVHVLPEGDDAFFLTDDEYGRIYYVYAE